MRLVLLLIGLPGITLFCGSVGAGVVSGRLTDQAGLPSAGRYTTLTGYGSSATTAGSAVTASDGSFSFANLPGGLYTQGFAEGGGFGLIYRKGVEISAEGSAPLAELSQKASAYCFDTDSFAFPASVYAQSFRANGTAASFVAVRCAWPSTGKILAAILDGEGPGAQQIGPTRSLPVSSASMRYACWHSGEVPLTPGNIYTVRLTLEGGGQFRLYRQGVRHGMRAENPDGRTWADGVEIDDPVAMVVGTDAGGIISTVNCLEATSLTSVSAYAGQTFTACGTSLLAVSWKMQPKTARCLVSLHDGVGIGGGGTQVGPTKYVYPAPGDQRTVVTFAPGEAPTVQGRVYYVKLRMQDGSGMFVHTTGTEDAYSGGRAYVNGSPRDWDFAMAIYEEAYAGAVDEPAAETPEVVVSDVAAGSATVSWNTANPTDSRVEFGTRTPYETVLQVPGERTYHTITVSGLEPNTLYHVRTGGAGNGAVSALSRDAVFLTLPDGPNLLSDAGFENETAGSWVPFGGGNPGPTGGLWSGASPRTGNLALGASGQQTVFQGGAYQRVAAEPGKEYRFSAWALTHTAGGNFRSSDRQTLCRIGIDPLGGTDPNSHSVVWSLESFGWAGYFPLTVSAVAAADHVTVFLCGGVRDPVESAAFLFDDAVFTSGEAQPVETDLVGALSSAADGSRVRIAGVICIAEAAQVGACYVESPDRCAGLRVETNDVMEVGDAVTVTGRMKTNAAGERLLEQASVLARNAASPIRPVFAGTRSLGGCGLPPLCPAVPGSFGPYNVGTLVRVAGMVADTGSGWIRIDDGSTGGQGLKVSTGSLTEIPQIGRLVAVTGVVRLEATAGQVSVLLCPRGDFDVNTVVEEDEWQTQE